MSDYTFNPKFITKSDAQIIEHLKTQISEIDSFNGQNVDKTYTIKFAGSTLIKYIIDNKSKVKPEELAYDDISNVFRVLKSLSVFSTSNEIIKEKFPTAIYNKRVPLFAILFTAEIIIPVE